MSPVSGVGGSGSAGRSDAVVQHSGHIDHRVARHAAQSEQNYVEFSGGVKINKGSVDWLSRLHPDKNLPPVVLAKLHEHLLAGKSLNQAFDHPNSSFAVQLAAVEEDAAKCALILRHDYSDPATPRYDLAGFAVNGANDGPQAHDIGVYQNPTINPELTAVEEKFSRYHLADDGREHSSFYQVRQKPVRLNSDHSGLYGFLPSKESPFARQEDFGDFSDPHCVAKAQAVRKAYHEDLESHRGWVADQRKANVPDAVIAEELVTHRNDTRLKYWSEDELHKIHKRNNETYGQPEGPTYKQLLAKYLDPAEVIDASFRSNPEADILTGLCGVKSE